MKNKPYPFSTKEEFTALCQGVSSRFDFLQSFGFKMVSLDLPGGNSFKDGFRTVYSKPRITVTIEYYDMELDFRMESQGVAVSFYFIDKELFGIVSGFHGSMFPREKLASAVETMASTIQSKFGDILKLDKDAWEAILKKNRAPKDKSKRLPG